MSFKSFSHATLSQIQAPFNLFLKNRGFFSTRKRLLEGKRNKNNFLFNKNINFRKNADITQSETTENNITPYHFRISKKDGEDESQWARNVSSSLDNTDFVGNRFPTLSTTTNYGYWKDRGLDRLIQRKFPFKIQPHRKVEPFMREYIFFLHSFDPSRFSDIKISERYCIKTDIVRKIREQFQTEKMIKESRLGNLKSRRMTREEAVALFKEKLYANYIGYQLRGEEETHSEKQLQGHKSTLDWINLQAIQVETVSAFPLMEKREPQLKRVDIDITVASSPKHKIMNWVDPTDQVVF